MAGTRKPRSEQLLGIEDSSGESDAGCAAFSDGEDEGAASASGARTGEALMAGEAIPQETRVHSEASMSSFSASSFSASAAAASTASTASTTSTASTVAATSTTNEREDGNNSSPPAANKPRRKSSGRYFEAPDVSIKCHRCGEVGHFSYDCVSDTPLVKLCSTCGEPGHSFIHCTNRICYNCGQVGHISNNCTSKRVRGLNRYLHDLLPKIRRHYSAFAAKDLSATQCMSCAEFGHVNCASEEADSKIGVFCPRCGSAGHTLADHIGNSRGRDTTTGGGHSNQYSGAPSGRSRSPPPSRGSRKKRTRLHQQQPLPRRPTPHVLDQQMRKKKKKKSKKTKLPPKATTTSKHYYTNRSKISKS